MNEAFLILWLSIFSTFLIRIYLLIKIKAILMNKNISFNFYSTSIIIGNIPKLPIENSNAQLLKKLYNNLTIVLYVLLFVNFLLLVMENF